MRNTVTIRFLLTYKMLDLMRCRWASWFKLQIKQANFEGLLYMLIPVIHTNIH